MICERCGKEFYSDNTCPNCGYIHSMNGKEPKHDKVKGASPFVYVLLVAEIISGIFMSVLLSTEGLPKGPLTLYVLLMWIFIQSITFFLCYHIIKLKKWALYAVTVSVFFNSVLSFYFFGTFIFFIKLIIILLIFIADRNVFE